jgi:hypothetical protein
MRKIRVLKERIFYGPLAFTLSIGKLQINAGGSYGRWTRLYLSSLAPRDEWAVELKFRNPLAHPV